MTAKKPKGKKLVETLGGLKPKPRPRPKTPDWVKCAHSKMVPTTDLVPNPRNPNTHPPKQIELLAKILDFQGWRLPIVVSNQSGFITRGHGRLLAAKTLDLGVVPVDGQDYETEAQEWADLVADNQIAELSTMNSTALKDILEELDTGELDLEVTGISDNDLGALMSQIHQEDAQDTPGGPITCPECGHTWND